MLHERDYLDLHELFTKPGYAGYKPDVAEIPNGDGKIDATKRYLHVALKYNPPTFAKRLLFIAHGAACDVAESLGVPRHLTPSIHYSALRVLEYPAGAGSELHTDFDLFTVNLWRSPTLDMGASSVAGYSVHMGELSELAGLGPAQPHSVPARQNERDEIAGRWFRDGRQFSLVYFAIPDHDSFIGKVNVGKWLQERIARSRVYK